MTVTTGTYRTSYEVALSGTAGPAYVAALKAMGVERHGTTSIFLMPVLDDLDMCDVLAMLEARGLVVLDIHQVPADRAICTRP